jgi:AraC family transcriptional regulator
MNSLHPVLVYLRPIRLMYVREIGAYERSIPKAWERLVAWLHASGLYKPVGRGYGLACDDPMRVGRESCRYDACVEADPGTEHRATGELGVASLPGGAYACQRLFGGYDRITSIVANVYSDFEPLPGLAMDESRPVVTLYIDNPEANSRDELRADICVPVTTASEFELLKIRAAARV